MPQAMSEDQAVGSPLKKQRANVDDEFRDRSSGFPSALGDVLGRASNDRKLNAAPNLMGGAVMGPKDESDEEL
jgi:hypothetical protein